MHRAVTTWACGWALVATGCSREYNRCEACMADTSGKCNDERVSDPLGQRDPAVARCFAARGLCRSAIASGIPEHDALCQGQGEMIECTPEFLAHFTFTCEVHTVGAMVPWR